MNKKSVLVAMMALALPMAASAADTSTTTVNTVGSKISTTASPETNRAVRAMSYEVTKGTTTVMAPEAQAFASRLQVGVSPQTLKTNHIDMTYPEIKSVSKPVSEAMNKTITHYVKDLQKKLEKDNKKAEVADNLYVAYDVKANGNGIFSVLIQSYRIADHGASGETTVKGFTFNTTTGKSLGLSDFGSLTKDVIDRGFMHAPKEVKSEIFDDVTPGKPSSFYAEENHDIVMIYQQGDIAPMSAGPVYIPVGNISKTITD